MSMSFHPPLLDPMSKIGQMPWLDKLITKNPLVLMFIDTHPIVKFTIDRMKERLDPNIGFVPAHRDFLSRSFESKEKYPDLVTDRIVRMWNIDNVFAGSDTTAIALRSIIYHLLRNPKAMEKLQNEIDSQSGVTEGKLLTWATANKMPYLTAVIKEGLRMHPAVGQLLERHVPKGGVTIGGHFLPEGTIVGMNPWVAARNKSVYGLDANCFRPERWLEASPEEQSLMERTNLAFGHGARTCVGKNISLLEIHKLVPELLRQFKFSFFDPEKDWTVHGGWFTEQDGLIVNIQRHSLES